MSLAATIYTHLQAYGLRVRSMESGGAVVPVAL
jgi:hypothetical protein